jgi:hypothetical protein
MKNDRMSTAGIRIKRPSTGKHEQLVVSTGDQCKSPVMCKSLQGSEWFVMFDLFVQANTTYEDPVL